MNFCITNPDKSNMDQVIKLYKQNRDTLGIPFNRVFEELLEDKNFIIATNGDDIIGFCGFKYKPRKRYYEIEHLCVSPDYRNQHIAIKLLQYHLNFNYINNLGQSLLPSKPRFIPVVAYAVDGKENNTFYDKISTNYDIEPRKTKTLRRYYLDIDRILNYGS